MEIRRKKTLLAVFAALAAANQLTPAFAQTPGKVEKIEVTGSNIKRIDSEGVAPVQVLTKDENLVSALAELAGPLGLTQ